jgi:hypothetical protein
VQLDTKTSLKIGIFFLMFYAIGQFIIFLMGLQIPEYKLYNFDNSWRVLIISISILLGVTSCKNVNVQKNIKVNGRNILYIYALIMPITFYLSYKYPWGIFESEVNIGHSFKALFRHIYTVTSLLFLLKYKKTYYHLLILDALLLFLDPSRFFFAVSIIPKIYLNNALNAYNLNYKKIFLYLSFLVLAMYLQVYRLNTAVDENFIYFSLYSDIMHSSYSALQLSQFSLDFPWKFLDINNTFLSQYAEKIAPLGGFFLPGSLFISGNIILDFSMGYLITILFTKIYIYIAAKDLNIILLSGLIFVFQKIPIINFLKILVLLIFIYWIISKLSNVRVTEA